MRHDGEYVGRHGDNPLEFMVRVSVEPMKVQVVQMLQMHQKEIADSIQAAVDRAVQRKIEELPREVENLAINLINQAVSQAVKGYVQDWRLDELVREIMPTGQIQKESQTIALGILKKMTAELEAKDA